jgi:hypothetical protein
VRTLNGDQTRGNWALSTAKASGALQHSMKSQGAPESLDVMNT